MYDSRLGRRWNIDPIVKENEGSYTCFANNPIYIVDPSGADSTTYLYSSVNADGTAQHSVEEMQAIADQSKKIDELNGIMFTKYKVYSTKDAFEKAIKSGEETISEFTDLAYEITDEVNPANFSQIGETRRYNTVYAGYALNGGCIRYAVTEALTKTGGKALMINLGINLAHERLIHGYQNNFERILNQVEKSINIGIGILDQYSGHDHNGLGGTSLNIYTSTTYLTLRASETVSEDKKGSLLTLFGFAGSPVFKSELSQRFVPDECGNSVGSNEVFCYYLSYKRGDWSGLSLTYAKKHNRELYKRMLYSGTVDFHFSKYYSTK